jgi:thymidylate synthase (FAD)
MKVNLVGLTTPSAYTGCHTAEELIVWAARVSNPSNQANKTTSARLLRYLITNAHWSPLELVSMTVEIVTTRDIARQILRHRSFTFQEYSQRYANPVEDLQFEFREARLQDPKNRQNSIAVDDKRLQETWNSMQYTNQCSAKIAYNWAIENGIAKEQARSVLPEGNIQSVLQVQGTIRSWIHYCMLRMKNGTQKEHAEVAAMVLDIMSVHFPTIVETIKQMEEIAYLKDKALEILVNKYNNDETISPEDEELLLKFINTYSTKK